MTDASTWFEIPSPFETAPGSVLLTDPPSSNIRKLRAMLLDETYPKPFVIDDGETRSTFGLEPTPWPDVLEDTIASFRQK